MQVVLPRGNIRLPGRATEEGNPVGGLATGGAERDAALAKLASLGVQAKK